MKTRTEEYKSFQYMLRQRNIEALTHCMRFSYQVDETFKLKDISELMEFFGFKSDSEVAIHVENCVSFFRNVIGDQN